MTVFFYYQWSINRSWDKQQYKKQTHCACDMVLRPCSRYDSTYSYQCLSLHLMSHSYVHTTHAWKCSLAAVTVCDSFFLWRWVICFWDTGETVPPLLIVPRKSIQGQAQTYRWWLYLSVKEEWAFIIFSCRLQQPVSMLIAVLLFVWSASTNLLSAMTFHPYRYVKKLSNICSGHNANSLCYHVLPPTNISCVHDALSQLCHYQSVFWLLVHLTMA